MVNNPVRGFQIVKTPGYQKEMKTYRSISKQILSTELDIVGYPDSVAKLHQPFTCNKCKDLLHARVDKNLRILYKPYYDKKVIFLTDLINHKEMDRKCSQ